MAKVSDISERFDSTSILTDEQVQKIVDIRVKFSELELLINAPEMNARCRATALTHLETASMWVTKGIAGVK